MTRIEIGRIARESTPLPKEPLDFISRVRGSREPTQDQDGQSDLEERLWTVAHGEVGRLRAPGERAESNELLSSRFAVERQSSKVEEARKLWNESNAELEKLKSHLTRLKANAEEAAEDHRSGALGIKPLMNACAEISMALIAERERPTGLSRIQVETKHRERQSLDTKLAQAREKLPRLKEVADSAKRVYNDEMVAKQTQLHEALRVVDQHQEALEKEVKLLALLTKRFERMQHPIPNTPAEEAALSEASVAENAAHGVAEGRHMHEDFIKESEEREARESREYVRGYRYASELNSASGNVGTSVVCVGV